MCRRERASTPREAEDTGAWMIDRACPKGAGGVGIQITGGGISLG